jgi:hypothetical protein
MADINCFNLTYGFNRIYFLQKLIFKKDMTISLRKKLIEKSNSANLYKDVSMSTNGNKFKKLMEYHMDFKERVAKYGKSIRDRYN